MVTFKWSYIAWFGRQTARWDSKLFLWTIGNKNIQSLFIYSENQLQGFATMFQATQSTNIVNIVELEKNLIFRVFVYNSILKCTWVFF